MANPTVAIPGTSLVCSTVCLGAANWYKLEDGGGFDAVAQHYHAYREQGGNVFDTAHCYSFWVDRPASSERLLGRCVREVESRRDDVIVCTKGGHITGGEKYPRPERYMTPELVGRDLAESLERLGLPYVDIYYLHRDDPAVPVDEILDALAGHQRAGRIRHYAASNWRHERIEQANAYAERKGVPPFVASQILWNLAHRSKPHPADMITMDDAELAWHRKSKLPQLPYSSTANGYFAGRAVSAYENATSVGRRNRALELGATLDATPAQVALAYLRSFEFPAVPIVGTTDAAHLAEVMAGKDLTLSPDHAAWLRDGGPKPA